MPRGPHLPPESTRWKKGQSGNPSGKPKNVFTSEELRKRIAKHFAMTKDQLNDLLRDQNTPAIDLILGAAVVKAIKDGDIGKAEYLFNRCLGKVRDSMEIVPPDFEKEALSKMTNEQLTDMVKNVIEERKLSEE